MSSAEQNLCERGTKIFFKFNSCQTLPFHWRMFESGKLGLYVSDGQLRVHSGSWMFSSQFPFRLQCGRIPCLARELCAATEGSISLVAINGASLTGAVIWQQFWNPHRYTFADLFVIHLWIFLRGSRGIH